MHLNTQGEEALAEAGADRLCAGVGGGAIDLHGVIEGEVLLVRDFILGEEERPLDGPVQSLHAAADGA